MSAETTIQTPPRYISVSVLEKALEILRTHGTVTITLGPTGDYDGEIGEVPTLAQLLFSRW